MNTGKKLLDDCFLHDKDRLRHDECLALILERLAPVVAAEQVAVARAGGRVLANPIAAPRDVPLHTNSAVDGYAFAQASLEASGDTVLPVVSRIPAGSRFNGNVGKGQAARIFTGAALPDGVDTVVMQEDCEVSPDGRHVTIPQGTRRGANIRRAGEDLREGDTVLEPGRFLQPQDVAAIASLGMALVDVFRPVRVALVSSGDELVQPGAPIRHGQVYDSNRAMLAALAASLPVTVTDLGALADDAGAVSAALAEAAAGHDLIITSGGASRGEEDHIVETIGRLGKRHLWQIAIKPGRPMAMGQIGDCAVIGLPGNPVAAFVCFLLYVRPAVVALGGGHWRQPQRYPVPAGFSVPKKKPDRREFWRGWLETGEDGVPVARKFPRDGSGLISGLRLATGLIEIGEDVTAVDEGDMVNYIPFGELGINGS
ncbi:MAG: molybdopterin molybdotransferase MoeA [Rhizobiaceae bacterium]